MSLLKLRDKPEALLGLVFNQSSGFKEHVSKEVFYKYEETDDPSKAIEIKTQPGVHRDDPDQVAASEGGYQQIDDYSPYGWTIWETKDGEFKYLLMPADHETLHSNYPYDGFVFVNNRADMMEFFIRIAPTVAAAALFNLMEGYWGSDHAPGGFSFSAALKKFFR